ncbi:MAG: hypothetical protein JNM72_02825 [Deltaproteobacteria bacterium]|nr:hypothetical protein [Deltaproteobacteria bacterium]
MHRPTTLRLPSSPALLGGLAVLLAAPRVEAARRTTVAVVGAHLPAVEAEGAAATVERLAAALDETGRLDGLEGELTQRALAGREDLVLEGAFLGPGRARLAEGRVLYERAEFEAAVAPLQEAVADLSNATLRTRDNKDLLDSLLLLGLTQYSLGEEAEARAAWSGLVRLDPARQLDSVNYPPKVVAAFGAARTAAMGGARGSLRLSLPEGAQAFVDGREASAEVDGLLPGGHYVLVIAPDGQRDGALVDVQAGGQTAWEPALARLRIATPAEDEAGRRQQSAQLYAALGQHAGANLVLLAGESATGKVGLQLYEPRTGNFSKVVEAAAGEDALGSLVDLVPSVAAFVDEEGALRADRVTRNALGLDISANLWLAGTLLDPAPSGETVTVTRKTPWYLWAGVAAVAAGGAATLAVVLTQDDGGGGEVDGGEDPGPAPVDPDQGSVVLSLP